MSENKTHIYANSLDNAKKFLDNQDGRKAPNNRVKNYHFFDIADKGAQRLIEELAKQQDQ